MKPTHTGKLTGSQQPVKLWQTDKFWCATGAKFRKTDGTRTGKVRSDLPDLLLESIEPLPTRILLEAPNGTLYTLISSNTKADTMVLRNNQGLEFETHISKAQAVGYKVTKYFD